MTGREVVDCLEREFQRIESPFSVTFRSVEDARAILMAFGGRYTQGLAPWRERQAPAVVAIADALNAEEAR